MDGRAQQELSLRARTRPTAFSLKRLSKKTSIFCCDPIRNWRLLTTNVRYWQYTIKQVLGGLVCDGNFESVFRMKTLDMQ